MWNKFIYFPGHTKTILQLFIHWNEPLLFSSSADGSIRIWSIDTFFEIYRFDVHEPIFNFKLIGVDSFLFTTSNAVTVSKLSLFYKLFSSIGSEALWISRASINGLPARIVYVGRDGAVRLVSPVHGKTITITFPIVGHELIDIVHDPRGNTNYAHLDNGDIMVFSTKTSPCRFVRKFLNIFIQRKTLNLIFYYNNPITYVKIDLIFLSVVLSSVLSL